MLEILIKPAIVQIILLSVQTLLYFGIQKFEGPAHDVSSRWDAKIPYWPPSVFVYILWFPLIAVFPLCLYWYSWEIYQTYLAAVIIDILISLTVYMLYPSSFRRPNPPDGFVGWVMKIVYRCDYKGKNCMPSMHCSMCFIIVFFSLGCMGYHVVLYSGALLLAVLIVLSTVLTKQHVIIDVLTAFLVAMLATGGGMLINAQWA